MKRLILLLLLTASPSLCQVGGPNVPGDLRAVFSPVALSAAPADAGVPVRDGLILELFAENYTNPGIGQTAIWNDTSGSENDGIQTTDSKKPTLLATNTLQFSAASSQYIDVSLASGIVDNSNTLAMVFGDSNPGALTVYAIDSAATNYVQLYNTPGSVQATNVPGGTGITISPATDTERMYFSAFSASAGFGRVGSAAKINGAMVATHDTCSNLRLGCWRNGTSFGLTGTIRCVFLYNRKLTDSEMDQILSYTRTRYGVALP